MYETMNVALLLCVLKRKTEFDSITALMNTFHEDIPKQTYTSTIFFK